MRGNIQAIAEHLGLNYVDPMMLHSSMRDRFPKTTLDGGYLGDAFPVCADLPPRAYLLHGAQYHRIGSKSTLGDTFDNADGELDGQLRDHFTPDSETSSLYAALCARDKKSGKCTFPADVELDATLKCTGKVECGADTLVSVKIVDGDRVVYYSYVGAPRGVFHVECSKGVAPRGVLHGGSSTGRASSGVLHGGVAFCFGY